MPKARDAIRVTPQMASLDSRVFILLLLCTGCTGLRACVLPLESHANAAGRHHPVACKGLFNFFGGDDAPEVDESGVPFEVRAAAKRWLSMSAAVAVSGGGTSDFSANGGFPSQSALAQRLEASQPALDELLEACVKVAPALVKDEFGACLPLARIAAWVPKDQWVRPLEEWEGPGQQKGADAAAFKCVASLREHLLEKWETPRVLHDSLSLVGDDRAAAVPEAAHRQAHAFSNVLAQAGSGTASVKDALETALCGAPEEDAEHGNSARQAKVARSAVAVYRCCHLLLLLPPPGPHLLVATVRACVRVRACFPRRVCARLRGAACRLQSSRQVVGRRTG